MDILWNNSRKIVQLGSSGCWSWVVADMKTWCEEQPCLPTQAATMWAPLGATHPWNLLAAHNIPLGACRSKVSQRPDHLLPCLGPILSHQADGRDPAEEGTAGKHHFALHPVRSRCCRDTAHQGLDCSPPTKSSLLPLAHTCSAEASKPCLPHCYRDLQEASPHTSSCGKVVHTPTEGSAKQFIWQRYPRLASCLQHWMNTLHSITKSCGLGTKDYSCQTR